MGTGCRLYFYQKRLFQASPDCSIRIIGNS